MAVVELDKKTSLDLREGEVLLHASTPNLIWRKYPFVYPRYNFVITSQRIALVPYSKNKEVTNIPLGEVTGTKPSAADFSDPTRSAWSFLYLYTKDQNWFRRTFSPKYGFGIRMKMGEAFLTIGKKVAVGTLAAMADLGSYSQQQGRAADIDKMSHLSEAQKDEAKRKSWEEIEAQSREISERMSKGPKKLPSNVMMRNYLVELISLVVEKYNKQG
jgi:hypothetical protein